MSMYASKPDRASAVGSPTAPGLALESARDAEYAIEAEELLRSFWDVLHVEDVRALSVIAEDGGYVALSRRNAAVLKRALKRRR